jgi:hypothetical protein
MIILQFFKTAFYNLDMEPELEPEPEPLFVKSRTGTVINSYGSATLVTAPSKMLFCFVPKKFRDIGIVTFNLLFC